MHAWAGSPLPTRRPLPAQARLVNPVVDFRNIDAHAPWWQADAVVCALGTTIKVAGSQQAFAAIDRDLVIATAQWAKQAGATRLALNSSLGASRKGNFYLRTKAEAEDGVRALGYPSLTIVRPSLIDAERDVARPGEVAGLWVARSRPLVPRRYRPVTAQRIAQALLEGVCCRVCPVSTCWNPSSCSGRVFSPNMAARLACGGRQ